MQYMLLIYEAPGQWPEDEQDQMLHFNLLQAAVRNGNITFT